MLNVLCSKEFNILPKVFNILILLAICQILYCLVNEYVLRFFCKLAIAISDSVM